jgi:hypothetical protein
MGSNGSEGQKASLLEPSICFSRRRSAKKDKRKVRADKSPKEARIDSEKPISVNIKPGREFSTPSFGRSGKKLEALEASFLRDIRVATVSSQTPIPKFRLDDGYDDDEEDDDIPEPVFKRRTQRVTTGSMQIIFSAANSTERTESAGIQGGNFEATKPKPGGAHSFDARDFASGEKGDARRRSFSEFARDKTPYKPESDNGTSKRQPNAEELIQVIDATYQALLSEIGSVSERQFALSVQTNFPIPLTGEQKDLVQTRLGELMNKGVQPINVEQQKENDAFQNGDSASLCGSRSEVNSSTKLPIAVGGSAPCVPGKKKRSANKIKPLRESKGPTNNAGEISQATTCGLSLEISCVGDRGSGKVISLGSGSNNLLVGVTSEHSSRDLNQGIPSDIQGFATAAQHHRQLPQLLPTDPGNGYADTHPTTSLSRPPYPGNHANASSAYPDVTARIQMNLPQSHCAAFPQSHPPQQYISYPPQHNSTDGVASAMPNTKQEHSITLPGPNQRTKQTDPCNGIKPKSHPPKRAPVKMTPAKAPGCHLCKKCPCNSKTEHTTRLSKRDANSLRDGLRAFETTLNRQIDGHVKAAEKHQDQADKIRRDIKRRKRVLLREEAKALQLGKFKSGQYRFLPDGHEFESQLENFNSLPLPTEEIKDASKKIFGDCELETECQSTLLFYIFVANSRLLSAACQLTLTQMFGVRAEMAARKAERGTTGNYEEGGKKAVSVDLEIVDFAVSEDQKGIDDAENPQPSDEESSMDVSVEDYFADSSAVRDEHIAAHRIEWRNGSVSTDTRATEGDGRSGTFWGALVDSVLQRNTGDSYACGFNRVFSIESAGTRDDRSFEQLLGLFGDSSSFPTSPAKGRLGTPSPSQSPLSQPDMPMLTQRGKKLAEEIERKISADSPCLADVATVCPQWKENVAFSMQQEDPADIQAALERVQQSKARLQRMKEGFMKAFKQHQTVLNLFEDSLNQSLGRLVNNVTPLLESEEETAASSARTK